MAEMYYFSALYLLGVKVASSDTFKAAGMIRMIAASWKVSKKRAGISVLLLQGNLLQF
jgi:hypothetical protein